MLLPRVSLRFALGYVLLPFQGVLSPKHHITQGVASLCPGLCAFALSGRAVAKTSHNPGCRFACPGLCAFALSGRSFQP